MNILPKKYSEFKQKSYWNNFFNQLKNTSQQNFEWYGNYFDFKDQLKKIFKHLIHKNNELANLSTTQSLSIFHIGCGKSTFGEDIQLQYPQFKVINTDYSEQVVKDMIKRSLMMKTMCKYEICDMFEPLQEKYQNEFNVVLDKGTLDAILPEDVEDEITKIKTLFFRNVQESMCDKQYSAYVIVSMLQPFVLRTILEHFFAKERYEIQIQQTKIKDSKMQPFLIFIKRYPSSQPTKIQKITLKLLKGNKELTFTNIEQTMKRIQQLQQTVASQQKVKHLSPYQHLTYNISNPQQPEKMRYTFEVVDNEEMKMNQNTCAVFIVPQGKENSFLFSNLKGLKRLVEQIGTSRVIVIKLLSGNVFKSIDQVKTEINPLISNFIQQGCDSKNVPFMTDAEQLGVRKNIYEDEILYIEEILSGQEEAIRRVILKNNLSLVQSQSKLIYGKAEDFPYAKELQKKTKILPPKKGKFTVIDKEYLDEGYCQQIVTGIVRFLKKPENNKSQNILVLGGGGYCIPKFLAQNLLPKPNLTTIQKEKSLCSQQALQIFQILHHTKSPQFTVLNFDAYSYILQTQHKDSYSSIVVDISGSEEQELPPKQFLSKEFVQKCSLLINENEGGLVVYNVLRKGFAQRELKDILGWKLFDLVLVGKDWEEEKQKQKDDEDCLVLYLVKLPEQTKIQLINDANKLALYAEELISGGKQSNKQKGKSSKPSPKLQLTVKDQQWLNECTSQIKLIYPVNKSTLKL